MIRSIHIHLIILFVLVSLLSSNAQALSQQTVELPLTVDFPLLRNFLVGQAFQEKGERATLVNEGGGCIYLALSSPQISRINDVIELDIAVSARVGTPLGDNCLAPLEWRGHLILHEQPAITPDTWRLSFVTVGSQLQNSNHQPTQITDVLWNVIKPHIWSYISGIQIDLMPPVNDLKNFILPLFPEEKEQPVRKMLASMRPGKIEIYQEGLRLPILADVQDVYAPDDRGDRGSLSEEELKSTIAVWEKWDGLLVYLVTKLVGQTLTDEEKRILTNVLLDTRYRFINELGDRTIDQDIVRQQFVNAWQQLAPLFRKHLLRDSKTSTALGYLAFFTSADALLVFDRLGPTLGLEISTSGLIRMARMLRADPALLQYRTEINTELQKLFQFEGGDPDRPSPDPGKGDPSSSILDQLLGPLAISSAYAAESIPTFSEILQWKVPKSNVDEYISRVEKILTNGSVAMIARGKVPGQVQSMFRTLVPAMAWQESCFRQFVVKGDKLTYLRSYNGSSVGVMQINERVWRGLYDLNRLRWDIRYNARAGSEVAAYYLSKYALRPEVTSRNVDNTTLARLVYALYNGGPSQLDRFFQRLKTDTLYESDKLFWQKYKWVVDDQINKVSVCLIGR